MRGVLDDAGTEERVRDASSEAAARSSRKQGAVRTNGHSASLFLSAGGCSMTRTGLRPVTRATRAYFAPLDRVNGAGAIFDPSKDTGFLLDAPPAPWIDL